MEKDRIDYKWEPCTRCHSQRVRQVDRMNGRYRVDLPARCLNKGACTSEMLNPFVEAIAPTPCQPGPAWLRGDNVDNQSVADGI